MKINMKKIHFIFAIALLVILSISLTACNRGLSDFQVERLSAGEYKITSIKDTSLTNAVIPDSVTKIGDYAFFGCTSLTSVTFGENSKLTTIGEFAFGGCDSLTSIVIPDSVTTIGWYAFDYCTSLTSITIPDSVTTIGYGVFSNCTSLTSVTIPDSVTSIDDNAFYNCIRLTDVYYTGTKEQWKAISIGGLNSSLTNATIHYNYVADEN